MSLRRFGGVLALVLALLFAPATTLSTPAAADKGSDPWVPPQGAFFNRPRSTVEDMYRLERQVVAAIRHAKPDSVIKISAFSFDRKPVAEALIKARRRGVKVQILLNDHQVTGAQRMLHRVLAGNTERNNFIHECRKGCRSRGDTLHTKFYLFSRTGGARHVVMTGSANLTSNGVVNMWNDLWVHNDNHALYDNFRGLFKEMRRDRPAHPGWWNRKTGSRFRLMATPFPNVSRTHDPMMSILGNVNCKGAKDGTGNADGRTIVRVSMHAWNSPRGIYLARRVQRLWREGCDVRVMYGLSGKEVRAILRTSTSRGPVPAHNTGYDTNFDYMIDKLTHQKYVVVSGNYGSDRSTSTVFTGSSNWTEHGIYGDEEIFRVKGRGMVNQYLANFRLIWTQESNSIHSRSGRVLPQPPLRASEDAREG